MNPIEFKGQTVTLRRPENMTDEECSPLPIRRENGDTCISCWQMSWPERCKAFFTGRVWVGVLSGLSQPPIYAAIDKPFSIPGERPPGLITKTTLRTVVNRFFKGATSCCRREI